MNLAHATESALSGGIWMAKSRSRATKPYLLKSNVIKNPITPTYLHGCHVAGGLVMAAATRMILANLLQAGTLCL
jgi:hypothetical protein